MQVNCEFYRNRELPSECLLWRVCFPETRSRTGLRVMCLILESVPIGVLNQKLPQAASPTAKFW